MAHLAHLSSLFDVRGVVLDWFKSYFYRSKTGSILSDAKKLLHGSHRALSLVQHSFDYTLPPFAKLFKIVICSFYTQKCGSAL